MHGIYNGNAPSYLGENFVLVNNQHRHNTRNSEHNFIVPRVNGMAKFNFQFQGVKIWNELPNNIKCISNKSTFKKAVKQLFKSRALAEESSHFLYY